MKITAIRTRLVDVPMRRPIVSRIRVAHVMTHLLVDLETDEGLTGQTYLVTFGQDWGRAVIELLRGLETHVRGMDPRETARIHQKTWQVSSMAGRRGLAVFAISAIDVAAWDVAAKALGVPLWQMLGGSPEPLDTYASEGLWLTDDLGRLGAEAAELVGLGFRAVKMRLGRAREADDLAAARAVRDAIGPDIRLMADANQGWDVEYALRLGRKLEDAGIDLTWFEEPIPHDDVAGQARLAAELRTPLATGNSFRCGILVDLFRGNSRRHDLRTTSSRHREACYCIDAPKGTYPLSKEDRRRRALLGAGGPPGRGSSRRYRSMASRMTSDRVRSSMTARNFSARICSGRK